MLSSLFLKVGSRRINQPLLYSLNLISKKCHGSFHALEAKSLIERFFSRRGIQNYLLVVL
jgi:hypothetical protein